MVWLGVRLVLPWERKHPRPHPNPPSRAQQYRHPVTALCALSRRVLKRTQSSYLSGSCNAAATFACRGDGSGTTVWPRSVFGDSASAGAAVGATTKGDAPAPANAQHKKFRYRLVAKCRVLKGDGVKEVSEPLKNVQGKLW